MPVAHLAALLRRRDIEIDDVELTRLLRGDPTRFQPADPRGSRWMLRRAAPDAERTGRSFVDRTPPLRAWQAEALEAWRGRERRGIVQAITGAGKSLVGITAIRDAAQDGMRSLVVVPTTPLLAQWEQSLLENLPGIRVAVQGGGAAGGWNRRSADVVVSTIQTASGAVPTDDEAAEVLLIADEAHHYAARTFRPVVRAPFGRRLGLTATLQRADEGDLTVLIPYLGPLVFELTYARALSDEVVCGFDVDLIPVDISTEERARYLDAEDRAESAAVQLEAMLPVGLSPDARHGAIVSLAGRGGRGADLAREYVRALDRMRDLLDTSPAKMDALGRLADTIAQSRGTIVFTQTVSLATGATRRLNGLGVRTTTLTAEHSREERRAALERFASGDVTALVAPQLLDEGIDVPDADLAVVLSASRSRRQMVQRMGRVIRPKSHGGGARFVIVFGRDTREDPDHGAHSSFLEEVLPLAGNVRRHPVRP